MASEIDASPSTNSTVKIHIAIYGSLARRHGGFHLVTFIKEIGTNVTKKDLMVELGIAEEERGYVFINAVLCDMPGLATDSDGPFKDGDHIGIFSITHMWPYQYRDGIRMSANLRAALQKHGAMHNIYRSDT